MIRNDLQWKDAPSECRSHRRNLKNVGDQALIGGLATAFPRARPGAGLSTSVTDGGDHAGRTSWPTVHMKPTNSRATAVQTMVVFLPWRLSAR